MSYADHRRPRGPALVAALLIQGALGYAFIAGLAYTYTTHFEPNPTATNIPLPPPPQPTPIEPQPRQQHPQPTTRPPEHVDVTPQLTPLTTANIDAYPEPRFDPTPSLPADPGPVSPPQPPQPTAVDRSESASAIGDQGGWFPQDAYPGGALSRGAEGRVSVTVGIGTDGRVTDCQVIASSGDRDLDAATCRLAKRNGRYRPALDRDGHPVASSTTLRNVRWVITGE